MTVFASVLGLGFVLSFFRSASALFTPIVLNFVLWTGLGFLLTGLALWDAVRDFRGPRAVPSGHR